MKKPRIVAFAATTALASTYEKTVGTAGFGQCDVGIAAFG